MGYDWTRRVTLGPVVCLPYYLKLPANPCPRSCSANSTGVCPAGSKCIDLGLLLLLDALPELQQQFHRAGQRDLPVAQPGRARRRERWRDVQADRSGEHASIAAAAEHPFPGFSERTWRSCWWSTWWRSRFTLRLLWPPSPRLLQ